METGIVNTKTPPTTQDRTGVSRLLRALSRRYRARRGLHRRIAWLGYTLFVINLVVLAVLVFDEPLGQAARNLPIPLVRIAGTVTDAGRLVSLLVAIATVSAVCLALAFRLTALRRRFRLRYLRRIAAYIGLSVLSASIIANILKYVIGRVRPPLYDQWGIFGFSPFHGGFLFESFPSAHSTNVGTLFAALALLFPRFRLIAIGLALWLGATRIIVGVHYPSDVIAGLALGGGIAFITASLFARFGLLFAIDPAGRPIPRIDRLSIRNIPPPATVKLPL